MTSDRAGTKKGGGVCFAKYWKNKKTGKIEKQLRGKNVVEKLFLNIKNPTQKRREKKEEQSFGEEK